MSRDWLIPASASLVFGVLAAVLVARLEYKGDKKEGLWSKVWKPLLGGICVGGLAGASAAEYTVDAFGAEKHPVLINALTGVALVGITVLIIDSSIRRVAARSWHDALEGAMDSAIRRGRRGAVDLGRHLRGNASRVDVNTVPKEEETKAAYELAREMSSDLSARVGRASLFAFASDESELGRWMQELSAAADTLQRTLERYSKCELSHLGEARSHEDVVREWRDYIWWLIFVDEQGRQLGFSSPLTTEALNLLYPEQENHTPSNAPPSSDTMTSGGTLGPDDR